jgi:hypothetical protein
VHLVVTLVAAQPSYTFSDTIIRHDDARCGTPHRAEPARPLDQSPGNHLTKLLIIICTVCTVLAAAAAAWQPQHSSCRPGSKRPLRLRSAAVAPVPVDSPHLAPAAVAPKTMPTIGTELQKCPLGFTIR